MVVVVGGGKHALIGRGVLSHGFLRKWLWLNTPKGYPRAKLNNQGKLTECQFERGTEQPAYHTPWAREPGWARSVGLCPSRPAETSQVRTLTTVRFGAGPRLPFSVTKPKRMPRGSAQWNLRLVLVA
ncbi:hypothetical protein D9M70_553690 [compost metagenome]